MLFIIAGLAVAAIIAVIAVIAITVIGAAVIAAFVFGMTGSVQHNHVPEFTVIHNSAGDGSYTIILENTGGASSIKGLHVQSPYLMNPDLIDPDTEIYTGQSVSFSPPDQTGPIHLIATSTVDGNTEVVIDMNLS